MLKKNQKLNSVSGLEYSIVKKIGEGGQGVVYEVNQGKEAFALKWYFEHMATESQKSIIENLITKREPSKNFLWPKDLVQLGNTFGYIMPLRPPHYKSIVDMMKRRAEPSFRALCLAGVNLAGGYQELHSMGYSYRDISFGNVFFNPVNGDVLICDNDNVSVNGVDDSGVSGTPRFMAPEIVTGEKKPSTDTDLFSMAVLLFYMFMLNHPLEGKKEANIKCLDINAMNQLYGKSPIFIWDPNDKSNRPVPGYHDNAIIYWDIYPKYIKELFIDSFTDGIRNPKKRIVEKVWRDAFIQLMDSIVYCPKCGAEIFFDIDKRKKGIGHICWSCQSSVAIPPIIEIGEHTVMLNKDTKITQHHIRDDYNLDLLLHKLYKIQKIPQGGEYKT